MHHHESQADLPLTIRSSLDRVFIVSLIFKGLDGAIELIGAIALIFIQPSMIKTVTDALTHGELIEEPHSLIANAVAQFGSGFTNAERYFLVAYLFIHAAVKLVSVLGIIRGYRWAYPFALTTLGVLTLYQLYEIVTGHASIGLILLTVFDVFILWLIWREYRIRSHEHPTDADVS